MSPFTSQHLLRRARTAAGLPGRVVACEDRVDALDTHVMKKIDEMRAELAEIRQLLNTQLESDAEATELLGRLLQGTEARLVHVEGAVLTSSTAREHPQAPAGPRQ